MLSGWLGVMVLSATVFDRIKRRVDASKARKIKSAPEFGAVVRKAERVIYAFGTNNQEDLPYYLLKCEKVVAVETDAEICNLVQGRFAREIQRGRLTVLNVALVEGDQAIHAQDQPGRLTCRTASSVVEEFGPPEYIRMAMGRRTLPLLRQLFEAGIFAREISTNTTSNDVFACLVEGGYHKFCLVDRESLAKDYGNAVVYTLRGIRRFQFGEHSAGPFGDDIRRGWHVRDDFSRTLSATSLVSKDIHAKRRIASLRGAGESITTARERSTGHPGHPGDRVDDPGTLSRTDARRR